MHLRTQDAHLYCHISPSIGQGMNGPGQVHAEHPHGFAQLEVGRLVLLLRLLAFQGRRGGRILDLFPQTFPLPFHFGGRDILLAEPVEILDGLVGHLLGLPQDGVGLVIGFLKDLFTLLLQTFLLLTELRLHALHFPAVGLNLVLLFLDGPLARFQVGQQIFEGNVLLGQTHFRVLNDMLRQPQLSRDGKRVALSGNADEQVVGGAQAFYVKLAAGIFYAGRGQGKHLQFAVMGGGHGADVPVVEIRQDGDGQRRPLRRVRARPQLVKEHQRLFVHVFQEGNDIGHVGGEGT